MVIHQLWSNLGRGTTTVAFGHVNDSTLLSSTRPRRLVWPSDFFFCVFVVTLRFVLVTNEQPALIVACQFRALGMALGRQALICMAGSLEPFVPAGLRLRHSSSYCTVARRTPSKFVDYSDRMQTRTTPKTSNRFVDQQDGKYHILSYHVHVLLRPCLPLFLVGHAL